MEHILRKVILFNLILVFQDSNEDSRQNMEEINSDELNLASVRNPF